MAALAAFHRPGLLARRWPRVPRFDDIDYVIAKRARQRRTELVRPWLGLHLGVESELAPVDLAIPHRGLPVLRRRAGGHHVTSVAIHAINAILLYLVLRRMTRAAWPSAMVAALFAFHPLHVESVAWVAERKDVLSTMFGLLALGSYARYAEQPGPGGICWLCRAMSWGCWPSPCW